MADDDLSRLTQDEKAAWDRLAANLTARLNAELDTAADDPGSPSARRLEAYREVSRQMVREGYWRFENGGLYLDKDGALDRLLELMTAAGLDRDDA
jgi:hypothetical protein